jgi:ClpP class serine protease
LLMRFTRSESAVKLRREATPEEARKQRRLEAAEAEERWLDEHDALVFAAAEVTFQADMLAHRLAYGLADLDEARQFLAGTGASANPYIDLAYLEHTCLMVEIAQIVGGDL